MKLVEFTGTLDNDTPAGKFVPFAGELDAPVSNGAETVGYDALGNQTGSPPAIQTGTPVADELGNLRDSLFSGVDSARASVKTVNTVAQVAALNRVRDQIGALENAGKGNSPEAAGLRKTAAHYESRLPSMIGDMAETQADAARGSEMTTRPAVAALNKAKTFGEAWDIFKSNPYDVIAGVSAQSFAATLPALITGMVAGPLAGAAAMGGTSALNEAGSSLADFAKDAGVDTTDANAVQAFFSDRDNLSKALSYAGKRAGIIGTLDAVSGGVAGKTFAPGVKRFVARQAVNLPAQMAVQAGLGAGGEALGQVATKGRIDQPGAVLAEAAGELSGAPLEVAAFSREVRDHMANGAQADPIAPIKAAPTADAAIDAATAAVNTPPPPGASAVDAISRILANQTAAPTAADQLKAIRPLNPTISPSGEEISDASQPVVPAGQPADSGELGGAVDAGGLGDRGLELAVGGGSGVVAGVPLAGGAEAVPVGGGSTTGTDAVAPPAPGPQVRMNPSGTLTVLWDAAAVSKLLKANGITQVLPAKNGVLVAKSEAEAAQRVLAPFVSAPVQSAAAPVADQSGGVTEMVEPAPPAREAPIVRFRKEAEQIEAGLPPVADGHTRLWRGNRAGEVGKNPQFTNDLPGIALPFRDAYKGPLSYVDVPSTEVAGYVQQGGAAPGAEFVVPAEIAAKATEVGAEPKPAEAAKTEPVAEASTQPAGPEPVGVWFGRAGDGYTTKQAALNALPARQRAQPDLMWQAEPLPSGKFRLAGYATEEGATVESAATTQGVSDGPVAVPASGPDDHANGQPTHEAERAPLRSTVGDTIVADRSAGSGAREERAGPPADRQVASGANPSTEAVATQPTKTPSTEGVSVSAPTRDTQRPLIELRKRKSVLESLLKCMG